MLHPVYVFVYMYVCLSVCRSVCRSVGLRDDLQILKMLDDR